MPSLYAVERRRPARASATGVATAVALFGLGIAGWLAALAVVPAAVLGWKPVVVTSGSMTPLIRPGDVVVAEPVDARHLGAGTVVVFADRGSGQLVTHRIAGVNADGTYVTRGDANAVADSTPLRPAAVVGVGRLLVPHIGLPPLWVRARDWVPFVSVVVALIAAFTVAAPAPARRGRASAVATAVAVGAATLAALVVPATPASARFAESTGTATSSFAAASPSCSTPGTQVVMTAAADSFVAEDKPANNFGTQSTISVKSAVGNNRRALVKFALPSPPAGCSIALATLTMKTTTYKGGRTLLVARAGADWTETGVTWANQPAMVGAASGSPVVNGPVSWNVTQQVAESLTFGDHGLIVQDSAEGDGGSQQNNYSSREGKNPPSLAVTYG